jgi:hypothetical protein
MDWRLARTLIVCTVLYLAGYAFVAMLLGR